MMKCYDTLTGQYKEVCVSAEVEVELKRSYWREEIAERRYRKRVVQYEEYMATRHSSDVLSIVISKQETDVLMECVQCLPQRDREILYMKYYCGLTNIEIGKRLGISNSYVGRLHKKLQVQIKESILKRYAYYT